MNPDWLSPTRSELRVELDRESGAVKAHEVDWYDEVVLREHPVAAPAADRRAHPRRGLGSLESLTKPAAVWCGGCALPEPTVDLKSLIATAAARGAPP